MLSVIICYSWAQCQHDKSHNAECRSCWVWLCCVPWSWMLFVTSVTFCFWYAECQYAKCFHADVILDEFQYAKCCSCWMSHFAIGMLSVSVLSVVMLNVVHADCHYTECHGALEFPQLSKYYPFHSIAILFFFTRIHIHSREIRPTTVAYPLGHSTARETAEKFNRGHLI